MFLGVVGVAVKLEPLEELAGKVALGEHGSSWSSDRMAR